MEGLQQRRPLRDVSLDKDGLIIDATKKGTVDGFVREWPDEIEMSRDIKEKVRISGRNWAWKDLL